MDYIKSIIILILVFSSEIKAGVFLCKDNSGKPIFSDSPECESPESINTDSKNIYSTGKVGVKSQKINRIKITKDNKEEYRSRNDAYKLSFGKHKGQAVTVQYEGFYIVGKYNIALWIDKARITRTYLGNREITDLHSLQLALYRDSSEDHEANWIHSGEYLISGTLRKGDEVFVTDVAFNISLSSTDLDELDKYKILGIIHQNKRMSANTELSGEYIFKTPNKALKSDAEKAGAV